MKERLVDPVDISLFFDWQEGVKTLLERSLPSLVLADFIVGHANLDIVRRVLDFHRSNLETPASFVLQIPDSLQSLWLLKGLDYGQVGSLYGIPLEIRLNVKPPHWHNRNGKREYMTYEDFKEACEKMAEWIRKERATGIVPIPRGGVPIATYISGRLGIPLKKDVTHTEDILIDDIVDYGNTLKEARVNHPNNRFACWCVNKEHFKYVRDFFWVREVTDFVKFPWEKEEDD